MNISVLPAVLTALDAAGNGVVINLLRTPDVELRPPTLGTWALARKALIVIEDLSVPFKPWVWQECATLPDACWDVHVICLQGMKRDTEPKTVVDGVHLHRYPLRLATGGPLGHLQEYATALRHSLRLSRQGGPVDVVHVCACFDLSTTDVCLAPDPCSPQRRLYHEQDRGVHGDGRPTASFGLQEAWVSAGDAAPFAPANDEQTFAKLVDRQLDDLKERRHMGAGRYDRSTVLRAIPRRAAHRLRGGASMMKRTDQSSMTGSLARIASQSYAQLRRLVAEKLFERRFGVQTAGRVLLDDLGLATQDRVHYIPTSWLTLRRALPRREVTERDVFIDFGSGMGRVVLEAATYPFTRVIGVELAVRLHDIARDNIDRNRDRLRCKNIVLVQADVLDYEVPHDVTVVYFNNPFRNQIFATVIQRLLDSVERKPRAVKVIYHNPVEDAFLMSTGRFLPLKTIPRPRSGQGWSPWGATRIYMIT